MDKGGIVSRVILALLPVLALLLLLRMGLGLADASYGWRLPPASVLIGRFGIYENIRLDIEKSVSDVNETWAKMDVAFSVKVEIVNLQTFFQAVGQFFKGIGLFFTVVGKCFVVVYHIVATPVKAVIYFFDVILKDFPNCEEAPQLMPSGVCPNV